jgi:ribonuclease HI
MGNETIRKYRRLRKAQCNKDTSLANFMAEWTEPGSTVEGEVPETPWVVYCNGDWEGGGATVDGAAAILISPSGIKLRYAAMMQFNSEANKCTNNIAEYEAILLGLRKLRAIGVQRCILHTNSKVVAGQIEKECIARGPTLERYLGLVRRIENYFKGFTVKYIEQNKIFEADEPVKAAAHNTPMPADVFFQVLEDASAKTFPSEPRVINIIEGEDSRAPLMSHLRHYYEPDSKNEQTRMQ